MTTASFIHASQNIDLNAVQRTSEGFLVLNAAPARAGDYEYSAHEVWELFPLADPHQTVIGRIETQDLKNALDTFKGAVITNDHPWPFVHFDNIQSLQVGHMGDAVSIKDDLVTQKAYITNGGMIAEIEAGKQELSIGFVADLSKVENKAQNEPDFYIRNIKINHVAVVQEGRAGETARLTHSTKTNGGALLFEQRAIRNSKPLTNQKQEKNMPSMLIHGVSYEVDQQVADAIAAERADHAEKLKNAKTQTDEALAEASKFEDERDTLQASNDELTNKSDAAAIANAVKDELAFAEKVQKVDAKYKHEVGADRTAIMREKLSHANNGIDYTDKSAAYVEAAFDLLVNAKQGGAGALDTSVTNGGSGDNTDPQEKLRLAHKQRAEREEKARAGV